MNSSTPYMRDGRYLVSKSPVGTDLKAAVRNAVDLIGGFDKIIDQDDLITIKPNLNTADPYPASSDPMFIKALGELLLDAGAGKLRIIESSTMRLSARKVSETVGLTAVADELDAEMIFLEEHDWVKVDIPQGKYLKKVSIGKSLLDLGKLVVAPNLKTHSLARYTGSLKIFVGWMRHRERIRLHMKNLEAKVVDLASYFSPDLIVMDARTCFITGGPASGQCSTPNLILASGDMVSIDVEGVRTIQCCNAKNKLDMDVWEIPQIRRAVEIGIGAQSDNDIEIVS